MHSHLYLITPPQIPNLDRFVQLLADVLDTGYVTAVQLRLKEEDGSCAPDAQIKKVGEVLVPVIQAKGAVAIVNDRADLAQYLCADGVHLGQSDGSVKAAHALLGDNAIIGVTCHNSKHLAMEAGEAGASYVAFGAFYPTMTKDISVRASTEILSIWREISILPSVAIGGINVNNVAPIIQAGADFIAVSSGVWNYKDGPLAAIKAFGTIAECKNIIA